MKTYAGSRYTAGALLLLYGFAKLTGAQFTTLDSELDKPMREVSGFWLTWYYFGYSRVYGSILALVQIAGAIALFIPRLALIAACILFLVAGNIVLIDIFYGVDLGGLLAAVVVEACLLRIIVGHRNRVAQLLLPASRPPTIAIALSASLVILAFGIAYYTANYNNRRPTPIDGIWAVDATAEDGLTRVYFERNRAFLCVFRYKDKSADHHFEVDSTRRTVRIWTTWLTKGPLLFEGSYDPAAQKMSLAGRTPRTLKLSRISGP